MNDKEMFDVLKPFMPMWCQKVLPAVFDQSLSYYELLCKILQKYNELVAVVNAHSEKLENHETRIVTLETITKEIQQKLAELDEAVKQNTANIAALTERVNQHDEDIAALQAWIDSYKTYLGSHRAVIDPTTHDIMLSVYPTLVIVPWSKWEEVIYNGGDSFTILNSNNAVGILSLTIKSKSPFSAGAFGAMIENDALHYFTATYTRQGANANHGGTDNWKEVELLDITNIKQSLGDGENDTISQKVLTQLINSKLNHDMGITGASAGQYLNIATVDSDGKPLTYGFGSPGGGGSGVDIVQTTGQSTTSVMSQKATTDAINTSAGSGASVVYPTTAGGTDGKFVDGSGSTLTRATLLSSLIGSDGKNRVFTVKKTGSSEWQRITWFKSAAGEGLYDFAWYETDGTSAKAGVDRLTMATTGLFAVSEESSKDLGSGSSVAYLDLGECFFKRSSGKFVNLSLGPITIGYDKTSMTSGFLKLPREFESVDDVYTFLRSQGSVVCKLFLNQNDTAVDGYYEHVLFTPMKQYYNVTGGSGATTRYWMMASMPFYGSGGNTYSFRVAVEITDIYEKDHHYAGCRIGLSESAHT